MWGATACGVATRQPSLGGGSEGGLGMPVTGMRPIWSAVTSPARGGRHNAAGEGGAFAVDTDSYLTLPAGGASVLVDNSATDGGAVHISGQVS